MVRDYLLIGGSIIIGLYSLYLGYTEIASACIGIIGGVLTAEVKPKES